jgi:hypothetical protein
MDLARPPTQLHSCAIAYNRGQPSGHLCLTPKLIQVLEGGKKRVLDRIFSIGRVAQKSIGISVKRESTA